MKTFMSLATAALIGGSASAYDVQVHGHSGQFTLIGSYVDTGNNYTVAKIRLAGVREVDAAGVTVGFSNNPAHSLNTFANQDFEYTTLEGGEFVTMSGVAAMRVAMDTPVNTIGRVGIDTYLFLESGNVTSEAGDEWWLVEEGDMKFNIFVSEWDFCNPCLLGNLEEYGESLEFDIEIKTGDSVETADHATTTTAGKPVDAAGAFVQAEFLDIHLSSTVLVDGAAADTVPLVHSQGSKTILTIPIPNFSLQAVYDPVLSPVPRSESANGAALASVTAAALAAAAVAAAL